MTDARGKLSAWITIAGSSRNADVRLTGWGLLTGRGWSEIVKRIRRIRADRGITTFYLRGPGGDDGRWPLDFVTPWWVNKAMSHRGIVEAFKPLVDEGLEIVPYFGSLTHGPRMAAKLAAGDAVGWLSLFQQTINPWLDAGCGTLAFDHIGVYGASDTPAYWAVRWLRTFGVSVLVEPHDWPAVDRVDGCVVEDRHWRADGTKRDVQRAMAELQAYRMVRIATDASEIQFILADGHECAATLGALT